MKTTPRMESQADLTAYLESAPILVKALPVELTNRNDGQGHSWKRTAGERKRLERQLLPFRRKPFDHPVQLRLTRVLGQRQRLWDADSVLRGNAKQLLDTLVALGWFHDDGPKWITEATGTQDDSRRGLGPFTMVEVFADRADQVLATRRPR